MDPTHQVQKFNPDTYVKEEVPVMSPTPDPSEIDDDEVEQMLERQHSMALKDIFIQGIFVPRWASAAYSVPVYAIAGETVISTHHDLDFTMWLPRSPYFLDHLTHAEDCRAKVVVRDAGNTQDHHYVVAYYNQRKYRLDRINFLVNLIMDDQTLDWADDLLIVKTDANGGVVSVDDTDMARCPAILEKFLSAQM